MITLIDSNTYKSHTKYLIHYNTLPYGKAKSNHWFLSQEDFFNALSNIIVEIYYSVQNKDANSRNPTSPIDNACRMSARSSFYIFRSMYCCKTLMTVKKLNPLRSQAEGYQKPLTYIVNRNSIPIWYQKHFLRPILIILSSKKWTEFVKKIILWEGCLR